MKSFRNALLGSLLLLAGAVRAKEDEEVDDGERVSALIGNSLGSVRRLSNSLSLMHPTAHSDAHSRTVPTICRSRAAGKGKEASRYV